MLIHRNKEKNSPLIYLQYPNVGQINAYIGEWVIIFPIKCLLGKDGLSSKTEVINLGLGYIPVNRSADM